MILHLESVFAVVIGGVQIPFLDLKGVCDQFSKLAHVHEEGYEH